MMMKRHDDRIIPIPHKLVCHFKKTGDITLKPFTLSAPRDQHPRTSAYTRLVHQPRPPSHHHGGGSRPCRRVVHDKHPRHQLLGERWRDEVVAQPFCMSQEQSQRGGEALV